MDLMGSGALGTSSPGCGCKPTSTTTHHKQQRSVSPTDLQQQLSGLSIIEDQATLENGVDPSPGPLRPPECETCGAKQTLTPCSRCYAVFYCEEHAETDSPSAHDKACLAISEALHVAESVTAELRNLVAGVDVSVAFARLAKSYPFYGNLGRLCDSYMRARLRVVNELLALDDRIGAVDAAAHTIEAMLSLSHLSGDRALLERNSRLYDILPALYLRLGKDQECYNSIQRRTTSTDLDDSSNADAFESVDLVHRHWHRPGNAAALTLLKIRLLLDLQIMESTTLSIGHLLPPELLDQIRELLPRSDAVPVRLMRQNDLSAPILAIEKQINELFRAIDKINHLFWDLIIDPGLDWSRWPVPLTWSSFTHWLWLEAKAALKDNYSSWRETPGAIACIKKLKKRLA